MNVLLIAFNRAELFARNIKHLSRLDLDLRFWIHFDGPRNSAEEIEISKQIFLANKLCPDAKILRQSSNLGCKIGVETAIDWFFDDVREGFIVEDDCILSEEFFTSIDVFSKIDSIDVVGAANFFDFITKDCILNSYPFMWGWWTKREVWVEYRQWNLKNASHLKIDIFSNFLRNKAIDSEERGNTWDFQWLYWFNQSKKCGLTVSSNLVNNIGFSDNATHTHEMSHIAKRKIRNLKCFDYSRNRLYDSLLFIFILRRPLLINIFYKVWKRIRRC